MAKISFMDARFVRDVGPFGVQAGFRDFVQRFARQIHHAWMAPGLAQNIRCLRPESFPSNPLGRLPPPKPFEPSPDTAASTSTPLRSVPPLVLFLSPSWDRNSVRKPLLTIPLSEARVNPAQLLSADVTPNTTPRSSVCVDP